MRRRWRGWHQAEAAPAPGPGGELQAAAGGEIRGRGQLGHHQRRGTGAQRLLRHLQHRLRPGRPGQQQPGRVEEGLQPLRAERVALATLLDPQHRA